MKLLFIIFFSVLTLNATVMGLKGGGCTLTQDGEVTAYFNQKSYKNIGYKPVKKSGKNFREIFVDAEFKINNNIRFKIIDYKPNKRIKNKPKTGVFIVNVTLGKITQVVTMTYIFDKGIMSSIGVIDKTIIGFSTKVNYSLCNVSIK
jgi:hypothetical protein